MIPFILFLAGFLSGVLLVLYALYRAQSRHRRRASRYLVIDGDMDESQY